MEQTLIDQFVTLINTVGFPIVCCGVLFYMNLKNTKQILELQKVIASNTLAITELTQIIKGDK